MAAISNQEKPPSLRDTESLSTPTSEAKIALTSSGAAASAGIGAPTALAGAGGVGVIGLRFAARAPAPPAPASCRRSAGPRSCRAASAISPLAWLCASLGLDLVLDLVKALELSRLDLADARENPAELAMDRRGDAGLGQGEGGVGHGLVENRRLDAGLPRSATTPPACRRRPLRNSRPPRCAARPFPRPRGWGRSFATRRAFPAPKSVA